MFNSLFCKKKFIFTCTRNIDSLLLRRNEMNHNILFLLQANASFISTLGGMEEVMVIFLPSA